MNILIYGTGGAALNFYYNILDKNKVNILAFVDREVDSISNYINEYPIIRREDIENYDYDYILIASTFTSIYTTLINDFFIKEYKIIPISFKGNHMLLEKAVLAEIVKLDSYSLLLDVKKSKDNELAIVEETCLSDIYIRNKMIIKLLKTLDNDELNDIYVIGKPNTVVINLIYSFLQGSIHVLHSIEESFQMSISDTDKNKHIKSWHELLEDEMKYSRKTILENIENVDAIHYLFGFYEELFMNTLKKVSFVYIEVIDLNAFKKIIEYIFESIEIGGYIYLYNPILTAEESKSNVELLAFVKGEYKQLIPLPVFSDEYGIVLYKL